MDSSRPEGCFRAPTRLEGNFPLPFPKPPPPGSSLTFQAASRTSSSAPTKISARATWATGKGKRLTAHLSPRSKLEVSWSDNADSGEQTPPLLTAQGEIAIDLDAQQMRTRSSWSDSLRARDGPKPRPRGR